jgi:UDP-N-acetylmuramyl pentapeptide phosphotransferase/UDP-N-acetylglucosamine-1-phosphate transferase
VALAAVAGGIVGVAMVGVMFWLSGNAWVVDDAGSHGISEQHSSRLGGIAVFFGAAAFFIAFNWVKNTSTPASFLLLFQDAFQAPHLCCALGIAVVGLWDDFATKFSPTVRLFRCAWH